MLLVPLLAAQLASPALVREVRAGGLVVRTAARASEGGLEAEIDVRGPGVVQRIRLGKREMSAQMLLGSVRIVDANFDGHPDVVVLREWGAKWSAVEVFLYDPATRRFSSASPLAHALSGLTNAEFGPHSITTHDIGPSNPSAITYVIERDRLKVADSCRFINPMNERTGTLVRSHGAHTTYTHVRLGPGDVEPCGS